MIKVSLTPRGFKNPYDLKTRYIVYISYTDRDTDIKYEDSFKLVIGDFIPWRQHLAEIQRVLNILVPHTYTVTYFKTERAEFDHQYIEPEEGDIETSTIA